jgi:hypothetical protein
MKPLIITNFLLLIGQLTFAQNNEVWTSFWDEESDLIGFKNSKNEIMIEPRFMGFTIARSFDNIIAVMEENNGNYETYYLTKSGEKVGIDSLHIYDNGADCESEGFIRFRDKKTDKVGMFDKNGNIVIPAVFDALSRTHNGLIWALKGAEKKYWDKHKESGCNHYSWKGGQELLLSTDNQILVNNFKYEGQIDFYSLRLTKKGSSKSNEISFKGNNGMYYTFTDLEKDFKDWFKNELLKELSVSKLVENSMDSITYWKEQWVTESKTQFIERNFQIIINSLNSTLVSNSDYFVSFDGLNSFMYKGDAYSDYFNTCGEPNQEQHPVMDVIINHNIDSNLIQDRYQFLKTDNGYQLISVSIRSEKIKNKP